MTIELHVADITDRTELIALQRRSSLANEGDREMIQANLEAIDIPIDQFEQELVITAKQSSQLLGFSAIYIRQDGNAELDGLFVEPDHWQKGIGRILVEAAAKLALKKNAKKLHVIGNPHAKEFYEKVGFVIIGEEKTQFGSGLLMVLELAVSRLN